MKKGRNLFDVETGTNDGAKVWNLAQTISLVEISEICNKNKIGFYRNGCLPTFTNKSGSELETIKKMQILFKKYNLEIVVDSNQKSEIRHS